MLILTNAFSAANDFQMAVTSGIIILYLIVIELISTKRDERETAKTFNHAILILLTIFAFIVIKKVMGILK